MRAALLVVLALSTSAAAADAIDPVPPKARKLAERGRELHERGDYARAITAFKEAYVLAPSPGLLFNLAQAYRLQGNCDDAAIMYRRFIATAPPGRDERALAETHLATVVRCVQKRNLNLPPDDAMASIPVPPAPGYDPLFEDRPAAPPSRGRLVRQAGIGTAAGGAVALGAAAYFGLRAHRATEDVEELYAGGASWQEIEPIHERGQRSETAAKWLGVVGGVGVAAGVTMYLLGRRMDRTPSLTAAPTQGGARIGMSWTF